MGRTRKPMSEQQGHLTKEQQTKRFTEQELVKTDNQYFRPNGSPMKRQRKSINGLSRL